MSMMPKATGAILGYLMVTAISPVAAQDRARPVLRVTYLANMGVLLEHRGRTVVIDGLHRGALADYAAVPPAVLQPLEQARPPFQRIDLAMSTHRHLDHFDPASVAARLRADTTLVYLAAGETIDTLVSQTGVSGRTSRLRPIVPPKVGGVDVSVGDLSVRVLDLPHNPTRRKAPANVGFLVDLGGVEVLHVGDADPVVANFAPHRLVERRIDVAVLPFWYFTGRNRAELLATIGAKRYLATHVPLADTTDVRSAIDRAMAGVAVLSTPGSVHQLAIERAKP